MQADGVDARTALEALIDEQLLVEEALRRGLKLDPAEQRAVERRMVRAMLRDIEAELGPESVREQEVRRDFERHAEKLRTPEKRRSWHILVKDPSDAGKKRAAAILEEIRRADEPETIFERYAQQEGDEPFEVEAEQLPAMTKRASIARAYKDALFAADSIGPLPRPVQTSHGWHAIYLVQITPAEEPTIDEVEEQIRDRLSQQKRFERVVAIVDNLRAQGLVTYDDDGVERLLARPELPRRAR